MANSPRGKKKARRANTVVLAPELREKLVAWVDQHPQKFVASELKCTERWLWNLRHRDKPLNKSLIIGLCKLAGVPFGPSLTLRDSFDWVPAEEEHVKWAASLTPTIYEEAVDVETKLKWLKWHPKGCWGIIHQ